MLNNCTNCIELRVHLYQAMTLAILFALKTMELLQIGVTTHFQATLASLQNCHHIDADRGLVYVEPKCGSLVLCDIMGDAL